MIEWKNIYNNNYAVSNTGLVKANERVIDTLTGPKKYQQKILKQQLTADGHLRVVLSNAGKKYRVLVHRLVAQAFIPNPNNYPVINHKDENPQNNNVQNLQWCTIKYNNAYNNLHERNGDKQGHTVKVYDLNDNFIQEFPSITKFANQYKLNLSTAWRYIKANKIINGCYKVKQEVN